MKRQLRLNNEFEKWLKEPFFTDDVNAYEIIYNLGEKGKGCYFKVTAKRADGVSITDIGDVSENGVISYTLAGNMYGVVGELILRVQVLNGDTALTEKILYAKVEKGESGTENPSTEQPAINSLLKKFDAKVDKEDGKGLSTNDYTNEDKIKVGFLENVYILKGGTDITVKDGVVTELLKSDYSMYGAIAFPEGITGINLVVEGTPYNYGQPFTANKVIMPSSLKTITRESFANDVIFSDDARFDASSETIKTQGDYTWDDASVTVRVKEFVLNEGLETVSRDEFFGNIYLEKINIPSNWTEIKAAVLGCCLNLKGLVIPATIKTIDCEWGALADYSDTIYGYGGTAAEAFAKEHNIPFVNIGSDYSDKLVGKKSIGENSAIFGSSTNEVKELELPDKIYYKPIAEEYYDIKVTGEPVFTTQAGQDVSNIGSWACVVEYNILYTGELYAVAENKIYKVNVECDSVFIELEAPTDVTYYNRADIPVPDGTEIKFYETEPTKQYKFENLTFTTDKENDTLLEKLYTYTDLWGNKCYTVYKDYTPDIANGSTAIAKDKNAPYELTEDKALANSQSTIYKYDSEGMLKGLRYEALFNKGAYFAVADGDNAFSSGEDNVASGDDTFSVGFRNIVLADGSGAIGRKLLVRGVGANGFGLNGKATGRYAIAFNEAGQALGYASLVFGDHCGAYDSYGVAGGLKSKNYAKMTFLYGNECIADKDVRNSFGGGEKIHIYKGFDNFIWGKELECTGSYNGITGAFHIIIGNNNLVGGYTNYVGSTANIVGGTKHTIKHYDETEQNGRVIISGYNNTLDAGWDTVLLGYHLHNIKGNRAFIAGKDNTNSGNNGILLGEFINSNGIFNVMLGQYLEALNNYNVQIGYNLESEKSHCWLIGEFLKVAGWYKIILGKYNAPSNNPFVVAYGSDDANRKNIFEVTDDGKAISKEVETEDIILKSPNGKKFKLTVNDNGELVTEGV